MHAHTHDAGQASLLFFCSRCNAKHAQSLLHAVLVLVLKAAWMHQGGGREGGREAGCERGGRRVEEGKKGLEGGDGDGDTDSTFVKEGKGRREERVRKRGKGGECVET